MLWVFSYIFLYLFLYFEIHQVLKVLFQMLASELNLSFTPLMTDSDLIFILTLSWLITMKNNKLFSFLLSG